MVNPMSEVKPIEGITPTMLWNFFLVLLGLCAIVVLVYKVVEIMRKEHERKELKAKKGGKDLTDEIADKVIEKLNDRLTKIEEKLGKDKDRLDNHENTIKSINNSLEAIKEGMEVSCNAIAEVLDHELHNGNGEQMQRASDELRKYSTGLIRKVN
jgi:archaellum component FlaC